MVPRRPSRSALACGTRINRSDYFSTHILPQQACPAKQSSNEKCEPRVTQTAPTTRLYLTCTVFNSTPNSDAAKNRNQTNTTLSVPNNIRNREISDEPGFVRLQVSSLAKVAHWKLTADHRPKLAITNSTEQGQTNWNARTVLSTPVYRRLPPITNPNHKLKYK